MRKIVDFSSLVGLTLTTINGLEKPSSIVNFTSEHGRVFQMYHEQDCCESVSIEDVQGDVADLIGSPILFAVETSSSDLPPDIAAKEAAAKAKAEADGSYYYNGYDEVYEWTFYRIGTVKGTVVVRWLGESNGYYSTSVSFIEITP